MEKNKVDERGNIQVCQKSKFMKKGKFKKDALIFNFVCMLIPVLQWCVFWLFINAQTISLAFRNPLTNEFDFTRNYKWLWMFQLNIKRTSTAFEGSLLQGLKNTMLSFGITLAITFPLCLVIAYFIYKKIRGYKVFRIAFYLPAVIPAIVLTTVYKDITQSGAIIDKIFHNVPPSGLLNDSSTALGAVIVFTVLCGFTTNVLLFSSGMARIPVEVIEAAKIDGVGPLREIVSLIIPLIWPTLTTQIILAFTGMFNAGGPVMLLNGGKYGTMTIAYWLFYQIAGDGRSGAMTSSGPYIVSAVGLALTMVAVPIVLLTRKLFSKVEAVEY